MTDNTNEIAKYKVACNYRAPAKTDYEIFARSPADAIEVAKLHFKSSYTDSCILDSVEATRCGS